MAWYNASWTYRVSVTVQSSQVDADLTDFPVYVDLSDLPAGFHTNVKSDGGDIRVTKSDGTTEVAREVVFYNATDDTGELRRKQRPKKVLPRLIQWSWPRAFSIPSGIS